MVRRQFSSPSSPFLKAHDLDWLAASRAWAWPLSNESILLNCGKYIRSTQWADYTLSDNQSISYTNTTVGMKNTGTGHTNSSQKVSDSKHKLDQKECQSRYIERDQEAKLMLYFILILPLAVTTRIDSNS